jgi:hypothetical protein
MQRRDFLTLAAASGLGLLLPPRKARAASLRYDGPYWITIQCDGGWDPTSLCDPKGGTAGKKDSVNQAYTPEQIGRAGEFSYAPISIVVPTDTMGGTMEAYSAKKFFESYGSRVLVINGIDTSTNNHETGRRVIWSGKSVEGYPAIGALAAANVFGSTPVPMAYLSYGGYDVTGGSVPLTRASNIDNLWRIAYPNRIDPKKADSATYHTPATADRIAKAQSARASRLLTKEPVPVMRQALTGLLNVRQGDAGLADLSAYLPDKPVAIEDLEDVKLLPSNQRGRFNDTQNLIRQGQLALAAFQGGVGVSASLVTGGYDTHSDHDNQHIPRLVNVLRAVEYLLVQAEALGLRDKLYIAVSSDFGRTPFYNAGNGKDHWAVTSMILSGPGIVGGRVIGATDAAFQPKTVDPKTLKESSTGTRITPLHIHNALRKISGLDKGTVSARFPLGGESLPFFA